MNEFLLFTTLFTTLLAPVAVANPCTTKIYNRGAPPQEFVTHLISWAKSQPDSYFTTNANVDIYSLVKPKLAPQGWRDLKHRRSAAVESLIVLGAYESSYDWLEGRDWSNPSSNTACTEEAGMWQTSGNTLTGSLYSGMGLKELFSKECDEFKSEVANDCKRFIKCTKHTRKHNFATSYTWLVIRKTLKHHGPLIRKSDVYGHLRPECAKYVESQL